MPVLSCGHSPATGQDGVIKVYEPVEKEPKLMNYIINNNCLCVITEWLAGQDNPAVPLEE